MKNGPRYQFTWQQLLQHGSSGLYSYLSSREEGLPSRGIQNFPEAPAVDVSTLAIHPQCYMLQILLHHSNTQQKFNKLRRFLKIPRALLGGFRNLSGSSGDSGIEQERSGGSRSSLSAGSFCTIHDIWITSERICRKPLAIIISAKDRHTLYPPPSTFMVTLSYHLLCVRGALSRSVKRILTNRTGIPQEHIVKSVRVREDIMVWDTGMMGWKIFQLE